MWIAFKLYFIDLWHSKILLNLKTSVVVNCFQIVFYRSLTQWTSHFSKLWYCCELLSNCILSIFDTVCKSIRSPCSCCELLSNCILSIFDTVLPKNFSSSFVLWIAFKLYFIDLWHSARKIWKDVYCVVNCFQIVFYRSLTQFSR